MYNDRDCSKESRSMHGGPSPIISAEQQDLDLHKISLVSLYQSTDARKNVRMRGNSVRFCASVLWYKTFYKEYTMSMALLSTC